MQTFLPFPDFRLSLQILDSKRLGKQRVEAFQLIRAITIGTGWSRHPAARMWFGYENALKHYYNLTIEEWVRRGFRNKMKKMEIEGEVILPPWIGDEKFHASHRSNLLRKDPLYYGKFGWFEEPNLPYEWNQDKWRNRQGNA
jgi:hypothetical protein